MTPNLPSTPLSVVQVAMIGINNLPAEILVNIFGHEGLAGIARQVCQHWRKIALPIWLKRLTLFPSDPFKDIGMLSYLSNLPHYDRLHVRALDISSRRDFDSVNSSVFYTEIADEACVRNVLQIQSLLGPRIMDLSITDTGWTPESVRDILKMNFSKTCHLHHFQLSLFRTESFLLSELSDSLIQHYRRDARHLKSLVLELALPLGSEQWLAMAQCTELQHFHLGLHRKSAAILSTILDMILPRWCSLTSLYLCQPLILSPAILRSLYTHLPQPERLRELHLIFEACHASMYEKDFIVMIQSMPRLQILDTHLNWTNRMMEHVAMTLADLRELSITCSNLEFTCAGIQQMVWGQAFEKMNMRTSAKISNRFLDAVRTRSSRVKILVYGSMKWGGSVDEWE